jgi:hypothetical protein
MKWQWNRILSDFLGFPMLINTSHVLHTHLSLPQEVCDEAAHYHTHGPKLRASSLTRHLAGLGVKISSFHVYVIGLHCLA